MPSSCPALSTGIRALVVRAVSVSLVIGWSLFGSGCAQWRRTKTPIPTVSYPLSQNARAETLIVFLPGRGDDMRDFERHGFLETMRTAAIKADSMAVGAHLGYYYQRTIITRLEDDVLRPARERGYRRIVVVGISLGGLGAVLCARDTPQLVDGLVLLSPYLGKQKSLFQQITQAGGPVAWAAGRPTRSGAIDDEIWTFLGQHVATLPPTFLCFGANDYLRRGQQTLAPLLPPDHVFTRPGAHDWKTWKALWAELCAQPQFVRAVSAGPLQSP